MKKNLFSLTSITLSVLLCATMFTIPFSAFATDLGDAQAASAAGDAEQTGEQAGQEGDGSASDSSAGAGDASSAGDTGSSAAGDAADPGDSSAANPGESGAASGDEAAGDATTDVPASDPIGGGTASVSYSLTYSAHVQNIGWMPYVDDSATAGTTGQSKRMEALRVKLEAQAADDVTAGTGETSASDASAAAGTDETEGDTTADETVPQDAISVEVHVASYGWQDAVGNDEIAGTVGKSKGIEAIRISLSDELAASYDIYYRVHSAEFGWFGWTSNGESAGSVGYGRSVQAIQIKLVEKGADAPTSSETTAFRDRADDPATVSYSAHVANIGWQGSVADGKTAGTTGQSKRVEALSASVIWYGREAGIQFRGHVQGTGWQGWRDGSAGTTGQSKRLEAIQVRLTGEVADAYDVWYRVHVANIGWLDWTSNASTAGSTGKSYAIEAVQIVLVEKGGEAPGATTRPFVGESNGLVASGTYINGASTSASATTQPTLGNGSSMLESFGFALNNQSAAGSIQYQAYRQYSGWDTSWKADGSQTDASSAGEQVKAVRFKVSGTIADQYDVYYRVKDSAKGWLGWASNGDPAGVAYGTSGITAIQVTLVEKGADAPGSTDGAFIEDAAESTTIIYQAHSASVDWSAAVADGATAGTTGKSQAMEALRVEVQGAAVEGSVQVSAHVADLGWQDYVTSPAYAGTTGKSKAIEAVKIQLTGELANQYDVYYRIHAATYGWLGWTSNGEIAGTVGMGKKSEAIQIVLVTKGATPSLEESGAPASLTLPDVDLLGYTSADGWAFSASNNGSIGTTGKSRALEAFTVNVTSDVLSGGVSYKAHLANVGWQDAVTDGSVAGSDTAKRNIECVQLSLTGELAEYYDIWYRAYVQNYGWLDWTSNGSKAGSTGIGYRLESLQVCVRAKGAGAPGKIGTHYLDENSLGRVLGVSRKAIVDWLTLHSYYGYYLGTPFSTFPSGFSPASCIYPKGSPRWDGYTGMNCTGFVSHVYMSVGGNVTPIGNCNYGNPGGGSYINAWRWYYYAIQSGATTHTFNSVRDLLNSGLAKKGDLIFFKTSGGVDCHIGIFWGDSPSENKIWHQISPYNTISTIFNNANRGEYNQQVVLIGS